MATTQSHQHLVIMAGGVGSRFWPMSSESCPKQFIDILGCGKTMLQLTIERFQDLVPMENIWIVSSERYAALIAEQLPQLPSANILFEPCMRGTAACIGYAAWRIKKQDPRATIVVSPADHDVKDVAAFRTAISQSLEFASETDAILTLGLRPTQPATGYGYIKADMSYAVGRGKNIYAVESFKEKPDLSTAQSYVKQAAYFWNSGIFVWSVSTIVNAYRVYAPQLADIFESLLPYYGTAEEKAQIAEHFPRCEFNSVDYAIMEKAEEVYVRPSDFAWSDLGTWSALHEHLPKDVLGNATVGQDVRLFESSDCIVHSTSMKKIVVQGLEGYIVVEKNGELLICKMSEEQRIKLFH